MVDPSLLDRLQAVHQRKRWVIGLRTSRSCRRLDAVLLGAEGRGLTTKCDYYGHATARLSATLSENYRSLRRGKLRAGHGPALLAAQLAECQAALLEEFAGQIAPVWDRVLAVALEAPSLPDSAAGLLGRTELADAPRLAELCGQNVIDGFALRDLALDGRGTPLSPLPYWLLLHDVQKSRVLLQWGAVVRATYLPASRDATGATRVAMLAFRQRQTALDDARQESLQAIAGQLHQHLPLAAGDEILLSQRSASGPRLVESLERLLPDCSVSPLPRWPATSIRPAATAVLGLLHLDQVPGNVPNLTGARTSRILGRLTPGSLPAWHRLLRELSAAKPSVMPLRSAI